jgi:CRP-like cAMP-binding protein
MSKDFSVSSVEINRLELFRSLPEDAIEDVRAAMKVERVAKNTIVFEQGQLVDRAFALAVGNIRILQTGRDGGQVIVRFISPGEMFGTLPLFTDHRFPADAIAAEASTVVTWSEQDLLDLMSRYSGIALNVIQVLGSRMAQLQQRVRELTTQRAEQRIAHAILRLVEQAGRDGPRGTTIEIPLRRKDLAKFAGTTLHTVSRTLAAWEKAEILDSCGQRLTIHDPDAVRRFTGGFD